MLQQQSPPTLTHFKVTNGETKSKKEKKKQ